MPITKKINLSVFALFLISSSFGQKAPMKFGVIPKEHLEMKVYEKDSNASAVVLADYGTSRIDYGTDQFQVIFERHIRIKILNKEGYSWGNGEVHIYHGNSSSEEFGALKGATYNLENGKMTKHKLEKQSVFEEKINDNWDAVKFSLPNVKEGSVIEYSYRVSSDFLFNYREWYFQKDIPVVWSEYRASFIEYYRYEKVFQGYIPFAISENEKGRQTFAVKTSSSITYERGRSSSSIDNYDVNNEKFRWVAKDVPAFIEEPYMTSRENYISKVRFELESSKFPNQPIKYYRGSWKQLNEEFLESENFGDKINGSGFLIKILEEIISEDDTDEDKVSKIYSYVKKNVKWNGRNRKYLTSGFRKTLENKKGSSAEINLLLTTLFKKAGINADPVLISTRTNGFVRTNYPVSEQFNYVICKVTVGDNYSLIDATEGLLPISVLPERCLNGSGYTISGTNPGWVDLKTSYKKKTTISGEIAISPEGEFNGALSYKYSGYNGLKQRKSYYTKGEEDFISDRKSNSKWDVENIELGNQEDFSQPFEVNYEIESNVGIESAGDIIYFDPMLAGKYTKNPFTLEKREYPIDFSSPIEETYYTKYMLPEGYQLETSIKPFRVALPERAGMFVFAVSVNGNVLTVMSKLNIHKTLFVMQEYPYIKEFFAQIVAKQNEQLVIKKL